MALHHDLLDQAGHLASREPRRPKQASLRRAVSTAYYALFHLLAAAAAKELSPARPDALRLRVGRAFAHGEMKAVCRQFQTGDPASLPPETRALVAEPLEAELRSVAGTFVALQEERHRADYDLSASLVRIEVVANIDLVRQAFRDWQAIRKRDNAKVFLAALLLQNRWNK